MAQDPSDEENRIPVTQTEHLPQGALSSASLRALILSDRPLIRDYRNLDSQLQPNGIDLALASVAIHQGAGVVGQSGEQRLRPHRAPRSFDARGWVDLQPGIYHITDNEVVTLPLNLMARG